MIIKTMIAAVILIAFVILALGLKMLFDKNAKFTIHSCSLEDGNFDEEMTCYKCQLKDKTDCPEVQNN